MNRVPHYYMLYIRLWALYIQRQETDIFTNLNARLTAAVASSRGNHCMEVKKPIKKVLRRHHQHHNHQLSYCVGWP